jgi:hypothetical protein
MRRSAVKVHGSTSHAYTKGIIRNESILPEAFFSSRWNQQRNRTDRHGMKVGQAAELMPYATQANHRLAAKKKKFK